MKTSLQWSVLALALLLGGCDAAKEPMAKAREAELAGKYGEAKTLYAEVCKAAENSPLCPVAKQRANVVAAREVLALAAEGQYAKAKELAAGITDPEGKRAIDALNNTRAMTRGVVFDETNAAADKAAARTKMEELSKESSPIAAKASEWIAKNGPVLLLADIKEACKPDGKGSCWELGKKIAKLYPQSPEAAEAKPLVEADYKRVYPLLKQAEALLVQRLEIANWTAKLATCVAILDPNAGEDETERCKSTVGIPEDRPGALSTDFLDKAWKKKLDEIHDPGLIKHLEDRYSSAGSTVYDPADWPKPADAKK